jgi:NAD(P)-dependent dehydrogenase (short-subunit alcohol dehydrogenase family)
MTGILAGKTALVTGGASGIGRATALAMAREGARIAVVDRDEAAAAVTAASIAESGGQAIVLGADVAREADVRAMVERTVAEFGRLDCAFNNAGIGQRAVGPAGLRLHELSYDSFERMLAINLTGVFLCMKHEIAQMLAQGGGAIVNTSSLAGVVGLTHTAHYVAAKHGVTGLTRAAALEYATNRIRVNCVAPGYIETPMTAEAMKTQYDATMAKVPMNRIGQPEEIAEAVVWLCSERASYVTGTANVVDGGFLAA